jgi:hypothetical protein
VLPVSAVYSDYAGLVTIGVGIRARSTESLGPISGESLNMPGMETVAERMADYVVGHHPTMPCFGKTPQSLVAPRRLEDATHASMMTIFCAHLAGGSHQAVIREMLRVQTEA